MRVTTKVTRVTSRGQNKTLHLDSKEVTSITITSRPPPGEEINVGDTVDVHFAPDGRKLGAARHPRSGAKRKS
jgi:hypothetical protein